MTEEVANHGDTEAQRTHGEAPPCSLRVSVSPWFAKAKAVSKATATAVATVLLLPLFLLYVLRLVSFASCGQILAPVPGTLGIYLRRAFYRATLASCGRELTVMWMAVFRTPKARVGHHAYIGPSSSVSWAEIGDDFLCSGGVHVLSGSDAHVTSRTDVPMRLQGGGMRTVVIGSDVWIGAGAVVMGDLGEGSVIGAGAVVTEPIPPYAVAVGVPARVVRDRREPATGGEPTGGPPGTA